MPDSNPELERLADKIGELQSLDWDQATRDSGLVPDTALCENLRVLSQIASFEAEEQAGEEGPRRWGPFEILERISVDEEGERWFARSESGNEIEVLWPPSHHHDPGHARADLVSAARAMVGLRHPHLVELMGADAFDGRMGIWMQASGGTTLEDHCREHAGLSPQQLITLGSELCSAVSAVHTRGRFQHALPPSGVLIDEEGHAVIRRLPHLRPATELRPDEQLVPLSAYHFAAPESLQGAAPTRASDVFAIAALLGWGAGADPELPAFDSIEALRAHREKVGRLEGLPPSIAGLLGKCLHKEASQRPATPELLQELWEDATRKLDPDDWHTPPPSSFWQRIHGRFKTS